MDGTGAEAPVVSAHESPAPTSTGFNHSLVFIWLVTGQQEHEGDFSQLAAPQRNGVCLLNCRQTSMAQSMQDPTSHPELPVKPC